MRCNSQDAFRRIAAAFTLVIATAVLTPACAQDAQPLAPADLRGIAVALFEHYSTLLFDGHAIVTITGPRDAIPHVFSFPEGQSEAVGETGKFTELSVKLLSAGRSRAKFSAILSGETTGSSWRVEGSLEFTQQGWTVHHHLLATIFDALE